MHVRMNMQLQHDGAPPHYTLCSRQVMNEIFDEKWIGRGDPVAWPPRSPDLISPDCVLWGFVKERIMSVAPTTPDDMKKRIRRACTEITPQMLAEVRRSLHQRNNKCLRVEGQHFEHLLLVDLLKVIMPICFVFSTTFILCVTRMTYCCRSLNSSWNR